MEPPVVLRKPMLNVLAAYYLGAFSGRQQGVAQAPYVEEKAEYRKDFSADNTRMTETSVIPMRQLDERTTTDLQSLINKFR